MLLAIVYSGLKSLKGGFVNPFQPLVLILGNACASHQKPACGKLCLGIATVGGKCIPEYTFLKVLLHTVTIPIGCSHILLTEDMTLESCFTIPEEGFVMILVRAMTEVIGIGHIDL